MGDDHRFMYAPNVFANAFITLSFASKLALSLNPLLHLVFPRKFCDACKDNSKILDFVSLTNPYCPPDFQI
jgi:hypothetical protein